MTIEREPPKRPSDFLAKAWDRDEWMHRVATILDKQQRELDRLGDRRASGSTVGLREEITDLEILIDELPKSFKGSALFDGYRTRLATLRATLTGRRVSGPAGKAL